MQYFYKHPIILHLPLRCPRVVVQHQVAEAYRATSEPPRESGLQGSTVQIQASGLGSCVEAA